MADTRCADPGLQLDLDLMVLEYTLYQAMKARLETLQTKEEGTETEAARLTLIFDAFIRLFNQNHAQHVKSEPLLFNIKILEFLILLAAGPANDFAEDQARRLKMEALQNRKRCQRWLKLRRAQAKQSRAIPTLSKANLSHSVECQIYSAWDDHEQRGDVFHDDFDDGSAGTLFDLLPRFMEISAEMASLLGDPNESWAKIASEFMLQAGLESLRLKVESGTGDGPGLEECFGWGLINEDHDMAASDIPLHQQDLEIAIKELFRRSTDDSDKMLQEENPLWTDTRHQYLSEFSIAGNASASSQGWRLERLTQKYPLEDFQDTLANYMEKVWEHHNDVFGIPILAEIEQGHMKSLAVEGKDFDDFMTTVGLRKASSGLLTFKFKL